ncbi:MAG: endo-1,4-beta-xylanase [Methyloceanibacter sp.]|nr:endo-1,4-beta-xylanase [Methyloceanibacter sp.]
MGLTNAQQAALYYARKRKRGGVAPFYPSAEALAYSVSTVLDDQASGGWTAVSGSTVTLGAALSDPMPDGSTACVQCVIPAGDTFAGMEKAITGTLSDYEQIGIVLNNPNDFTSGKTVAIEFRTDAAGTKRRRFTFGSAHVRSGPEMLIVRVDGTSTPGGASWDDFGTGMLPSEEFTHVRVIGANSGSGPQTLQYTKLIGLKQKPAVKPMLLINFEGNGFQSHIDIALPKMQANNMLGFLSGDVFGASQIDIDTLYNEGWDYLQSGRNVDYSTNPGALNADFQDGQVELLLQGYDRCADMFAFPSNKYAYQNIGVLRTNGVTFAKCEGPVDNNVSEWGVMNPLATSVFVADSPQTLPAMQAWLDDIILLGGVGIIQFRELVESAPGAFQQTRAVFEGFIDYVKTKVDSQDLQVVTPTQYLDGVSRAEAISLLQIAQARNISLFGTTLRQPMFASSTSNPPRPTDDTEYLMWAHYTGTDSSKRYKVLNQLTTENVRHYKIKPTETSTDWSLFDLYQGEAAARGIPLRFHFALGHLGVPSWWTNGTNGPARAMAWLEECLPYIKDKVTQIDLCNEMSRAPSAGGIFGHLRPQPDMFGASYDYRPLIRDWYQYAKETLPGVELRYNDFLHPNDWAEQRDHRIAFLALVDYLVNTLNVKIDGVGIQGHLFGTATDRPSWDLAVIETWLNDLGAIVENIHLSEFDVRDRLDDTDAARDAYIATLTKDFLDLVLANKKVKTIDYWGSVSDRYGVTADYGAGRPDGKPENPMPYSRTLQRKPLIYAAARDALIDAPADREPIKIQPIGGIPDQTWGQYAHITPIEVSSYIPGAYEYVHSYNLIDTDGTTVIETGLPRGVTVHNRTGRMTGAPVEAQAAASCTVWGLDAAGTVIGTQTFNITVTAHAGTVRSVSNQAEFYALNELSTTYTGPGAIVEVAAGASIDIDIVSGGNYGRFTGYEDATPLVIRSADPDNPGTITMNTRSWSFDGPNAATYGNVYFDNITFFRPWQGATAGPGAVFSTTPLFSTGGASNGQSYRNIGCHNCRFYSTVIDARTKGVIKTGEMTAFLFSGNSDTTSNITITSCEGYNLFNFGLFRGVDVHIENSFLRDSWGDFARIAPNTDRDADNISIVNCWHYGQNCDGLIRHADFIQGASTGGNNRTRNLDIRGNVVFASNPGFASLPAITPAFNNTNMVFASTNQTASTINNVLYRLECDVAASDLTLQLPAISTVPNLFQICLQNYGESAFKATALRNGSDTIDGAAANLDLPGNFQAIRFYKNGAGATGWTIQRYGPAMQSVALQNQIGLLEYVRPNIAYNIFWDTLFLGIGLDASALDGRIRHCSVIPDKPQVDINGSGTIGPEDGAYATAGWPAFSARGGGTLTIENSFAAAIFNDSGATITQNNVDVTTLNAIDDNTVKNNLVGIAPQTIQEAIDFAVRKAGATLPANCGARGADRATDPYDWLWRCMKHPLGTRPAPTPIVTATNVLYNTDDLTKYTENWASVTTATPWKVTSASDSIVADATDTDMFLYTAGPSPTTLEVDNFNNGRSGYVLPSEAGRLFVFFDVKAAANTDGAFTFEVRDWGSGGDFPRLTYTWSTNQLTKFGGTTNLFGVINRGNGVYRPWVAIEKVTGTRVAPALVKSMPGANDMKIARIMMCMHDGDTPPPFVHGPTA